MKKNCWITMEDEVFGTWELHLPLKELIPFKQFTQSFLELGEAHGLFLLSLDDDLHTISFDHPLYLQEIERLSKITGTYYSIGYHNYNKFSKAWYFFSYYTKAYCYNETGTPQKYFLYNMGKVLKEINPMLDKKEDSPAFAASTPPLKVSLISADLDKASVDIWIQLKTDLYFPKVYARHSACKKKFGKGQLIDNTELAQLNTPNFNEWLNNLAQLAKDLNGNLKMLTPYDHAITYAHHMSDKGISI